MDKNPVVYILTNQPNGVLYIGVTSNLTKRMYQHRNKLVKGFTSKYNLNKLVWYQTAESMGAAISEEKRLKKWNCVWKLN